jgi:hypothetical protein
MVPHLNIIPMFGMEEVVTQKIIFPLDPECTHSSKSVELEKSQRKKSMVVSKKRTNVVSMA